MSASAAIKCPIMMAMLESGGLQEMMGLRKFKAAIGVGNTIS